MCGLLVFTHCPQDGYTYDCAGGLKLCKMFCVLSSTAATWPGCPGSLQTMSVVAVFDNWCSWTSVFDNWCSWTCAAADGVGDAIWGMSVPAVLWSLKWDHLISEWQSYPRPSPQSPCLLGAGYIFSSKWLAIRQPGLAEGTTDLLLLKHSSCTISSTSQNQEYALHSSWQH